MPRKYIIRRVNAKDPEILKVLTHLHKHCLPYDEIYDFKKGDWWIAYDSNGSAAGFAGLAPSSRWINSGYLCRAGVVSYHRGNGLQKRLIRVRIARAKALKYEMLFTDTSENCASANSLISCGFRLYDPIREYGLKTALYWRLFLKKSAKKNFL